MALWRAPRRQPTSRRQQQREGGEREALHGNARRQRTRGLAASSSRPESSLALSCLPPSYFPRLRVKAVEKRVRDQPRSRPGSNLSLEYSCFLVRGFCSSCPGSNAAPCYFQFVIAGNNLLMFLSPYPESNVIPFSCLFRLMIVESYFFLSLYEEG